jgi:hypothetical protein
MPLRKELLALLFSVLVGCGDGSFVFISNSAGAHFVFWSGNSNGSHVVDVNNKAFAFNADNGCLFNFQTGHDNPLFCLTSPTSGIALFGPLRVRVVNIRSQTGPCIAALVDEATACLIAIELDDFAREVVVVTKRLPVFCSL